MKGMARSSISFSDIQTAPFSATPKLPLITAKSRSSNSDVEIMLLRSTVLISIPSTNEIIFFESGKSL